MQPYQYFDNVEGRGKTDYALISRWFKQALILIVIALVLITIAYKASVCTGSFEGDPKAVCEKIIK